jgi:hypothetical protein
MDTPNGNFKKMRLPVPELLEIYDLQALQNAEQGLDGGGMLSLGTA